MPTPRFGGQVALVTGAGQGMGRAVALGLAAEGARVVVGELDPTHAAKTVEEIKSSGGEAVAVQADVSNVASVGRLFEAAVDLYGTVDILVNNAGIAVRGAFLDYTEELWDRQLGVNLKGVFFCSQAAARIMIPRRKGKIVNFASVAAFAASSRPAVAYDASKGGVRQMTISLASVLAPYKINVNAVAPGTVRTEMNRQSLATDEGMTWQLARIPLGRVAEPEDISRPVLFLCSSDADYMTGHVLVVDGGWLVF
jgi:NAD(P)-dependent dehydrogenase (short-subunit alcohol dehydrogenase family)